MTAIPTPPAVAKFAPGALADPCEVVPLSSLKGGTVGRVHAARLACDDCDLLNAMGLTDQCEIRVCRSGEPCIVQVHGTRLGLSGALAQRIFITVNRAAPNGLPQGA